MKASLPALALAAATPAFAATQLERSAGVEAGTYSLDELVQIVSADEANDAARLKKFLGGRDVPAVSRRVVTPVAIQRAAWPNQGSDR